MAEMKELDSFGKIIAYIVIVLFSFLIVSIFIAGIIETWRFILG